MHLSSAYSSILASALFASVTALPTISAVGSKFFTSNGDQWFIKGVAYQLTPSDPLLDTTQCTLDANLMQTLGTNAIRVYHVVAGDHSGCMSAFENAGIYIFVDLDTFSTEITALDPMWTQPQLSAFETVMDEFQQYDNTAGFFIGNEVLNDGLHTEAAPFIKSAVRDMKAYSASKSYRTIPIGYSHADVTILRPNLQNYLTCGSNVSENIDFFGLNTYEWCGDNTYDGSGYAALTDQIVDYPIPIFISETGCNTAPPRTFQDQAAIFGSDMTPFWSGAIIYEWIQVENHYGVVTYGDDTDALVTRTAGNFIVSGTPTPVSPDFMNLKTAWAAISPSGTPLSDYKPTSSVLACPSETPSAWEVAGNVALPTLGQTFNQAVQFSITAGIAPTGALDPNDPLYSGIFQPGPAPTGNLLADQPGAIQTTTPSSPASSSLSSPSSTTHLTSAINTSSYNSFTTGSASAMSVSSATTASSSTGTNAAARVGPSHAIIFNGANSVFGTMAALGAVTLGFCWWL